MFGFLHWSVLFCNIGQFWFVCNIVLEMAEAARLVAALDVDDDGQVTAQATVGGNAHIMKLLRYEKV